MVTIDSQQQQRPPHEEPNVSGGDPTDARNPYEWESRYPPQALVEIRRDAIYLFLVLIAAHFLIFATWKGWVCSLFELSSEEAFTLKRYSYYAASGMLGGVIFGIKYFYRVVARGYWHLDRRIWRIKSPFIAMTIALIVGAMISAGLITTRGPSSGAAIVSIGFLAGYFADEAVGKMYEIATVIFGKSATPKAGDGK